MMAIFNREQRPLKRPRIGPPDCYPQISKQKEDDLSGETLKNGFKNTELIENEIASARPYVTVCDFPRLGSHFKAISEEKERLNNVYDINKKKNQVNYKDVYWPVTGKNRNNLNAWLQDLASNKPLKDLSKKIPTLNSNRKEDVFQHLSYNSVPLSRSTWFIKLLSTGYNTSSDSKKKRPGGDLSQDWTQALTKYLKDLVNKLSDHQTHTIQGRLSLASENQSVHKDFAYNIQLADWLYQEGLLQRHSFLQWLIDTLDKTEFTDTVPLNLLIPLTLKYIRDIAVSQPLARTLAGICTRYISFLYSNKNIATTERDSKSNPLVPTDTSATEDLALLSVYNNCQQHYPRLTMLACILQIIAITCPGALVWSLGISNKDANDASGHRGSPLDYLPGSICQLPGLELLELRLQKQMKAALKVSQKQIQARSALVENRWSSDKCKESDISLVVSRVLSVLEILDKYAYARPESGISVDGLYSKIFPSVSKGISIADILSNDEPIVMHLLEWAITPLRYGYHRPILVATLLQRRHYELEKTKLADNESHALGNNFYLQDLLLRFLDHYALLPSDEVELELEQSNLSFRLFIALFAELIRRKIFSHDNYVRTLISRGDIPSTTDSKSDGSSVSGRASESDEGEGSDDCSLPEKKNEEENIMECGSPFSVRRDSEADISDQLKQQLSQQQEELQQLLENNDRNHFNSSADTMEYDHATDDSSIIKPDQSNITINVEENNMFHNVEGEQDHHKEKILDDVTTRSRKTTQHITYVLHFPLPEIDLTKIEIGSHESRQRLTVLYGVGATRNLAIQEVAEMWDDISSCLNYLNTSESSTGVSNDSNRSNNISILAPTIRKFKTLHIHSQYAVANTCANTIIETLNTEIRYPSIGKFNFAADLMEIAGDVYGLLRFAIRLLNEGDCTTTGISSSLLLIIVAVFRRYYNCLLVSTEQTTAAVDGLWRIVKHITNPASCSSADRCALACLSDIFTHCTDLKFKHRNELEIILKKVKDSVPGNVLSKSNDLINSKIFCEEFKEPREANPNTICQTIRYDVMKKYNFVCNAILHVYHCGTYDRLLDIATLCAEVTSYCSGLNSEWMGVLRALCYSPSSNYGFTQLLSQLEISDSRSADNIAMFTAVLISRHCFSLEELLRLVILPTLCDTLDSRSINQHVKIEAGARLSYRLLLRLLEKSSYEVNSYVDYSSETLVLKSWDRSLLSTWHHSLGLNYIYIVLKTMAAMVDFKKDNSNNDIFNFTKNIGILEEQDTTCSNLALNVLKSICVQPLIQQRVLHNLQDCCSKEFLLDSMLTKRQAIYLQCLLCCTDGAVVEQSDVETDINKEELLNLLKDINLWSLRTTWLEIELYIRLCKNDEERTRVVDSLAEASIEVYRTPVTKKCLSKSDISAILSQEGNICLIAPFVSKLSTFTQGRILKAAGEVLERSRWWLPDDDNPYTLNYKPFLSLILTCLQCEDEHKRSFLVSSQKQFQQFLRLHIEERMPENMERRDFLNDALHLRLSLVGAVFDTILRDLTLCKDWIRLLLQFIASKTMEMYSDDKELLNTILDMLLVLINTLNASESVASAASDEARKVNASLIKKFRKELDGINSPVVEECKKLFSIETSPIQVVSVSTETIDTKCKNEIFKTVAIDQPIQLNNWEIIESPKFSSPTLWSHFAGVKVDRKPLTYNKQYYSTMQHNHMLDEPPVFYLSTNESEVNQPSVTTPTTTKPNVSKATKNRASSAKSNTTNPTKDTPAIVKSEQKPTKPAASKRQRRRSTIKEKDDKHAVVNTTTVSTTAATITNTMSMDSVRVSQYYSSAASGTAQNITTFANSNNLQSIITNPVNISSSIQSYNITDRSQSEIVSPKKEPNSGCYLSRLLQEAQPLMTYGDPNRRQMQTPMATSASDFTTSFQPLNNTMTSMNQRLDNNFNDTLNLGTHSDNLSHQSLQSSITTSSLLEDSAMMDNQIANRSYLNMPPARSTSGLSQDTMSTNQPHQSNNGIFQINKFTTSHSYH